MSELIMASHPVDYHEVVYHEFVRLISDDLEE